MKSPIRTRIATAIVLLGGTLSAMTAASSAKASERIISTDGFVTELILALGQQNSLVAVDVTSRLPNDMTPLPNIGYHRNLSAEGLLSLRPTIVIGSEHVGPASAVTALASAKVPLLRLKSAHTAKQLEANIESVATALHQQNEGTKIHEQLTVNLAQLSAAPLSASRIAFLLSMSPDKLRLAGTSTTGNAFIKLLGAQNVARFENYQNVSAESLLAMKPSIILVAGRSTETAVSELLAAQPVLAYSSAANTKAILSVDGDTLVSGLSLAAIEEALRIAHTFQQRETP